MPTLPFHCTAEPFSNPLKIFLQGSVSPLGSESNICTYSAIYFAVNVARTIDTGIVGNWRTVAKWVGQIGLSDR